MRPQFALLTHTYLTVSVSRGCNNCGSNTCVAQGSSRPSSAGVSKGALAGGILGAVIFLAVAIALFLRYRKKSLLRKTLANAREAKDIPAPAETVLNRPDPIEKPPSELSTIRVYTNSSETTIDLDPQSQASSSHPSQPFLPPQTNPFDDTNSIQTAGTEGTNVIPIALVQGPNRLSVPQSESNTVQSTTSSQPSRPARSPDLNLNLDHVNVSHDNLRSNNYAQSTVSGISRNSYMSSASYSSDFLNEAPMIMTSSKGAVRQVLGVVKAEVISAGSLSSPNDSLKPPAYSRPVTKSPLASTSFGPNDVLQEANESQEITNPFSDENMSTDGNYGASPSPSATTFARASQEANANMNWLNRPFSQNADQSRPSSMATQAGSVIDIASATRVNVGLKSPASANSYRTTMGRLVTPPGSAGTLQEQQQRALAHAQAQAQAQGLEKRRISGSSVLSATSTLCFPRPVKYNVNGWHKGTCL